MQVSATVVVCPAVTVTDVSCAHGSSCGFPDPFTVSMYGERPEIWYVPGDSHAEILPEDPTWTATCRCPAAVKVTVPGMGGVRRAWSSGRARWAAFPR
jgi:hypothetical protein